jgi:hypothetical protein
LDAGIVVAAADDGVLLDPIIEVAGAELVLPLELDPTFVLIVVGASVAVGVAGTVDAGVAVDAAGSDELVGGGLAIAAAALFCGTVSEVEFSVKPAIRTSPTQPILHSRPPGQTADVLSNDI